MDKNLTSDLKDMIDREDKENPEKMYAAIRRLPNFIKSGTSVLDIYGRLVAKCTNEKDAEYIIKALEHFKTKELD